MTNAAEQDMLTTANDRDWSAEGNEVVELTYLGYGRYQARKSFVVRRTTTLIVIEGGLRFWRDRQANRLVGERNSEIAGFDVDVTRLVPLDHPRAVQGLEGK